MSWFELDFRGSRDSRFCYAWPHLQVLAFLGASRCKMRWLDLAEESTFAYSCLNWHQCGMRKDCSSRILVGAAPNLVWQSHRVISEFNLSRLNFRFETNNMSISTVFPIRIISKKFKQFNLSTHLTYFSYPMTLPVCIVPLRDRVGDRNCFPSVLSKYFEWYLKWILNLYLIMNWL